MIEVSSEFIISQKKFGVIFRTSLKKLNCSKISDNMKKVLFLFVFSLSLNKLYSQGLIFDKGKFNSSKQLEFERGILPPSYTLEKYLPLLYPQTGGTCVAMSFSLARTVMLAKENNILDKNAITKYLMMSPYFLYYLGRDKYDYSCSSGLDIFSTAEVVKNYGFSTLSSVEYPNYYPFTSKTLCPNSVDFFPPVLTQKITAAKKYKVDEVYVTSTVEGIKFSLSKGNPVVLAMQIPESFEKLQSAIWISKAGEKPIGGHAIVAIGYNDNIAGGAIRIANSWGDTWADKGKAWIPYKEIKKWMDGAFIMQKKAYYKIEKEPLQSKLTEVSQIFNLKQFNSEFKFDNSELLKSFEQK
jgi:hypothetical protein